ncbi:MAG: hypothetical protein QM800_05230 [Paludibacter sp.]
MRRSTSLILSILVLLPVYAQVSVYTHMVKPEKYPDYNRRNFSAPVASESFHDTVRFVAGRYVSPTRSNLFYGDFYRPNQGWILNQGYFDFYANIISMGKEKVGVFDVAGYGPGSPYSGSFGQKTIPTNRIDLLNKLGSLYIGNSLGEQDGRYWADQRQLMEPYSRDAKIQHNVFLEYMRQNAKDYGYKLTQLTTFWGFHYMPKDGYISMLGSECQNKDRVTQMQIQYAFNRGASRQYGLLTFGDISVYNTWGYKGNPSDSIGGNSYSLMRRMMALQFQYNAWILGIESGWGTKESPKPIGEIQKGMYDLVNKELPNPGCVHVPVALFSDFFSGWMPPYGGNYYKWGFIPYDKGQHLTHALLNIVYPGYQNNGQYKDETYAIVPNQFGDVDVILSDIQQELLLQYPMIVIADELTTDINETKSKLDKYVREGGNLILTAVNARKLFPLNSFSEYETIAPGAIVTYNNNTYTESTSFLLATPNFSGYQTIATTNNKPLAIELNAGKGKYSILLTDYGLSNATTPVLLNHTKAIVSDKMSNLMLFSAGSQLTCTTNILNDSTYIVGIYNNSLVQQALNIQSKIGNIKSMYEFSLGNDLTTIAGYKPNSGTVVMGTNSANTIRALDCRLFKIIIQKPTIQKLDEVIYPVQATNKYLSINNLFNLKNTISAYPHFFYHFSGIKTEWDQLGNYENSSWKENVTWINHQKLGIVVDFAGSFPLVDFRPENVIEFFQLNQKLSTLKNNLLLLSGEKIIVLPEASNQLEYTGLIELKNICNTMNAKIITKAGKCGDIANVYNGREKSIQSASLVYLEPSDSTINFNALQQVYNLTPVVFNNNFVNWDSIYNCLNAIYSGSNYKIMQASSILIDKKLVTKASNQYKFISLHDIQSIRTEILKHQSDFFDFFGGIKIDATYLWDMSEEACKEEGRWLKRHNIKVIVDMIREINHYPNLTWTKELNSYGRSKQIMDNILLKMQLLGSTNVVIGSHMRM